MNNGKSKDKREPIAIIGIGCRFPGEANDPQSFWRLLCGRVDAVGEIPRDRWNIDAYYDPTPGVPGKTYSRWGGFIQNIDAFEPECFGISPREAGHMDPQQRVLLEVSKEAIEDAALDSEHLSNGKTGVFVGISTYDYAQMHYGPAEWRGVDPHSATGGASSIAANRISYCLNLQGPSIAVDTACSSSLVAIDLACRSLWGDECHVALAGGVNAIISPGPYIAFCAATMLSRDGRCKTFDASADGFVRGEGAGIVVLKLLRRALEDGDPIYALIGGTAVNHDGRTSGIALPSQTAQESLVLDACRSAGVLPHEVDYVEAHGTGTEVGDPIEARALGTVLCNSTRRNVPLLVGSAKTNVGHLEAGAGIVGVIKTALALRNRLIPPNLHFNQPNPNIPFKELRLRVPCQAEPWPQKSRQAIAGVNSFGFGGTNAHVLMTEYCAATPTGRAESQGPGPWLMTLSARTPEALTVMAERYRDHLGEAAGDEAPALPDACYTTQIGRGHYEHRLALTIDSRRALEQDLTAYLEGERRPSIASGRRETSRIPPIAFVFAGQGSQWWGMGQQLLAREAVFRETIESIDAIMLQHSSGSLVQELTAAEDGSRIQRTEVAQPALFAIEVALARLWNSWGIRPDAVIGHSVGEVAAAYVAGALSLEDAVKVIYHRSRCMERASSKGQMLAATLTPSEAEEAIAAYGATVSLAAINGPSSVTLSGEPEALESIRRTLSERGVFSRTLQVDYAFHSAQMDAVREPLLEALSGLEPKRGSVEMISTVTGDRIDGHELNSDYWWRNVRRTVRFGQGINRLVDHGYETFLELGPHPVLAPPISECLSQQGRTGLLLASLRRGEDEKQVALGSLGSLYTRGYPVDWKALWPARARRVRLPKSPWNRQSYWQESEGSKAARLGPATHPLLGDRLGTADPVWENRIDLRALPFLKDHKLQKQTVLPATAYVEMAIAAASELFTASSCVVEELRFHKALFLQETGATPVVQFSFCEADSSFAIRSRLGDEAWTLHATGSIAARSQKPADVRKDIETLRRTLPAEFAASELYAVVAGFELNYGPSFRGLERMWRRDGEALGAVSLPAHLAREGSNYRVHPALLDACYQVLVAAFPLEQGKKNRNLFLPVFFGRIDFYASPGASVWSHLELTNVTNQAVEGNFRLYDAMGRVLVEVRDFRCQAVEEVRAEDAMERWFYEVRWHYQVNPSHARDPVDYLSHTRTLLGGTTRAATEEIARSCGADTWLDRLAAAYIVRQVESKERETSAGGASDGLPPSSREYDNLFERFHEILQETGQRSAGDAAALWPAALARHPAHLAELTVLGRLGARLGDLLAGRMDASEIEASSALEHLLQDSPSFRPINHAFVNLIERWISSLPETRSVRILELDATLGGVAAHLLPKLPPNRSEYIVCDRNPHFLERAHQKLRVHSFARFEVLDPDRDPVEQGFETQGFDLILVPPGRDLFDKNGESLNRLRRLLVPGGVIAVQAWEALRAWQEFVFGVLARPRAKRVSERPVVSRMQERRGILGRAGFTQISGRSFEHHSMLLGRNPLTREANGHEEGTDVVGSPGEGAWIVFADRGGIADRLIAIMEASGQRCTRVLPGKDFTVHSRNRFSVRPDNASDMDRLLMAAGGTSGTSFRGAIHLWTLDAPGPEALSAKSLRDCETLGCHALTHLVQSLDRRNRGAEITLAIVTAGAQEISDGHSGMGLAAAPAVGLGRVIANEHPEIRCKLIDLSADKGREEITRAALEILNEHKESEIALRGNTRFVPRLERADTETVTISNRRRSKPSSTAFRVALRTPGVIENLRLQRCKRSSPGPGEVEIEVHAAALNFRDIMKTLGLYPTDAGDSLLLGDECSGRIVAVGGDVTGLGVGDAVMAIAPASLGSHVTTAASVTMPKPKAASFAEAATLPVAFATAQYALHNLAHLQAGDKVLIHSAAGGVGLAAIQIAQRLGAQIFATAGSPEKREFLELLGLEHVMDSRSLSFADEVMDATHGSGVDVVLNSLAGQAIAKGVSCLAPHGRFLEIGKRDIYENSKLGLSAFRKNLSFHAIDLGSLMADRPETVKTLMADLCKQFEERSLRPLPHRVFTVSQFADAFRYMAQARHIGKVVIGLEDAEARVAGGSREAFALRPDGTYLVTGGLGGMGLTVARWLEARGARNIVLVGRRGSDTPGAHEALSRLNGNARVLALKADVSDKKQLQRVLRRIERDLPPLRGILHTAMVLDDGIVLHLDRDRFHRVMAPKVQGAWNLHQETYGQKLDFFVLFSSLSSLVGNQGQGNYVAANAFLDQLAHYRQSLGLPALAINWGHLAGAGYVAEHAELGEALTKRGILGISPEEAMEALDTLLQRSAPQVGVMRVDWNQLGRSLPERTRPRRLASLIHDDGAHEKSSEQGAREAIVAATGDERRSLLLDYVAKQAARVMGTSANRLDIEAPLRDLGLDSLMAVEMRNRIESELRLSLPTGQLMQTKVSVVKLAQVVLDLIDTDAQPSSRRSDIEGTVLETNRPAPPACLVSLRSGDKRPPLFCIHPAEGDVRIYEDLVERLPTEQPVYGVQRTHTNGALGTNGRVHTIAELASEYASVIRGKQSSGGYSLLGFSLGGLIAAKIANILEHEGEEVSFLGLVDCDLSWSDPKYPQERVLAHFIAEIYMHLSRQLGTLRPMPMERLIEETSSLGRQLTSSSADLYLDTILQWLTRGHLTRELPPGYVENYVATLSSHIALIRSFDPEPLRAPISMWWAGQSGVVGRIDDWCTYTSGEVSETTLDATHVTVMEPPHVDVIAAHVANAFGKSP